VGPLFRMSARINQSSGRGKCYLPHVEIADLRNTIVKLLTVCATLYRRIRSSLDFGTVRIIATAFVHSKLDYCNSLYYHLPSSQITNPQNSLARAVTKTPRFCHISLIFQSLHWLKIEQRTVYKLNSLTYTALQHNSPSYL